MVTGVQTCALPISVEVAELEVLRLTRKSRTAHHNLVIGVVTLFVAILVFIPLLWVDPKIFKVLFLVGSGVGAFGLFAVLQGTWQLHRALNRSSKEPRSLPAHASTAPLTRALPPMLARTSVTEGTTELLVSNDRGRSGEPARPRVLDTGEVDDEHLM